MFNHFNKDEVTARCVMLDVDALIGFKPVAHVLASKLIVPAACEHGHDSNILETF